MVEAGSTNEAGTLRASIGGSGPAISTANVPSSSQIIFGIMSEQAAPPNDTKQHSDPVLARVLPPLSLPPVQPSPLPPSSTVQTPQFPFSNLIGDLINSHSSSTLPRSPLDLLHSTATTIPPNPIPLPTAPNASLNVAGDASLSLQQQMQLQQQQQRSPEVGRPLNVTDALSYLDAVKNQFQDKPEVYNQFLDIMKDFKSQVIDTPGVIERVSRLFHGNPALIQGFNTFLPVGYRIDISADPLDNTITVTTPNGTMTQSTGNNAIINRLPRELPALAGPGLVNPLFHVPGGPPPPLMSNLSGPGGVSSAGPSSRALTPHGYHPGAVVGPGGLAPHHHPPPFADSASFSPGFQQQTTHAAAASFLGNLNNKNMNGNGMGSVVENQTSGEFNHAIQYLNKIKARFSDDPNTYKQFLDILQTYQKEQRQLHDSQVYVQVQMLFKDAPDLIAEFKDFLPEAVPQDQGGMMISPQPQGPGGGPPMGAWGHPQQEMRHPSPPPPVPKKATQASKRKKRPIEKEPTPAPPPKQTTSRQSKKVKHHHMPDTGSPSFSPYTTPRSPPLSQTHIYHTNAATVVQHGQPSLPSSLATGPTANNSADKLLFFDRAKKSLESREVYEEFLKLLSLFSKDIIDVKTLVERAKVFLGDDSLMSEFKDLIGWDERMENSIEHGPPGSIRTAAPDACAAQPVDDGEGPSYRKLPKSEISLACSGRDELCRSVLNDEWVSHPTWASEEAGFVTHKKNSFEEALHKSEEERHEYHVHILALTRTISVLEPLNLRIEEMTPEERSQFRLKADFGGPSKTLYHRTIRRIYGRDNGLEVIQAMQDCPSVSIPVVLARLKQKDEEWRRAQREWSRTWREVDSKNFYKSLDHQGISFKQNDKKCITTKHFVGDIEAIKAQQTAAWEERSNASHARHRDDRCLTHALEGYQLEYTFADTSVLLDSVKMVYSFLERSQVQYSPQERRSVDKFLRAFIPRLCNYPESEFNAACGHADGAGGGGSTTDETTAPVHETMTNGHHAADSPRSGRRSSGGSPHSVHSNGVPASDLRKKLLKTAQEKASRKDANNTGATVTGGSNTRGSNSAAASRSGTPLAESRFVQVDEEGRVIPDVWIREAGVTENGNNATPGEQAELDRPFFANTTFYTLLRLLQLLYSRLLMSKEIGADLAAKHHAPLLANRVAVELGLDDPSGPAVVLAQTMEALGDRGSSENANVVYMYLLSACDKLFDNDMDQATFEEHMRWFFGTKAYHLFTLDKLITALIKQVQTVLSDHKCQELWTLLQIAQASESITQRDIIRYRRAAEKHVGPDDHFYRIQWNREKKAIRISLTGQEDATIPTDGRPISRWREYVNTYVMTYPTECLPSTKLPSSLIFLRRCLQGNDESTASTILRDDHTRIRVSLPTYKLVYENGCEDMISRAWCKEEREMLRDRARARSEDRKRCRLLCS